MRNPDEGVTATDPVTRDLAEEATILGRWQKEPPSQMLGAAFRLVRALPCPAGAVVGRSFTGLVDAGGATPPTRNTGEWGQR
jgi:hypothetical protein